eukprot:GHUV01019545.1.p2 GENE.GHUV01019545.1~~GHUV01019545.1.p2  ORF type:complete len:103 (-),score=13.65 GHUV01019545.1:931-1239(-)
MKASLPPSSSVTGVSRSLAAAITFLPTSVLPTNTTCEHTTAVAVEEWVILHSTCQRAPALVEGGRCVVSQTSPHVALWAAVDTSSFCHIVNWVPDDSPVQCW